MVSTHLSINPYLLSVPAYTRGKSMAELKRELGVVEVVKLGSNENPLGPSPAAVKAIQRAATDSHRYPSVEVDDLRAQLAASLHADLVCDNIIVGNGSADVILSLAKTFSYGGGQSIISYPAFQMYELATNLHGGECVFVDHQNFDYDLQAMAERISDRTRLIFITNPNNPTGRIVSQQAVDAFMARVPPTAVVVFDEAYHEYADAADYPDTLRHVLDGRNVIVTRTFSKIYGLAGLRMGYGIGRRELIDGLLRSQIPFHSGRIPLAAAMASLADREYVAAARQANCEGKCFLYSCFDRLGLRHLPTQANFILLVDLPHEVETINQGLLGQGVIVRPAASFGLPQALRITIGTQRENERFVSALENVLATLQERARP